MCGDHNATIEKKTQKLLDLHLNLKFSTKKCLQYFQNQYQ